VTSEGYNTWIIAEAPYAETPPVIDGTPSAGEWDDAESNPLSNVLQNTDYSGELEGSFSVMWDATYLYILIEASDSVGMAGQGHAFELYISTPYNRQFGEWKTPDEERGGYQDEDYQLICLMNPAEETFSFGLYSDTGPFSSFLRRNAIDGTQYTSEVRIAWTDLGGLPADKGYVNSDYIGFEVHIERKAASEGGDRTKRSWSGIEDVAWANTEEWGTLRLLPGEVTPPLTWAGYEIVDGWVDTEEFLGYLNVQDAPWIYSLLFEKYIYIEESMMGTGGGWLYVSRY
jgi:hypothetical protein